MAFNNNFYSQIFGVAHAWDVMAFFCRVYNFEVSKLGIESRILGYSELSQEEN